jgi:ribosomal protein S18 acetylase RimI-like enzyme
LLQEIQAECRQRAHDYLLLVCDEASASGRAFVTAVGAHYQSAEYRLALDPPTIDRSRPRPAGLQLRLAGADEAGLLVYLQAASFGDPAEETENHVAQGLRQPGRQYFIGWLDHEPVGLLRLSRYEQVADITAFGVLPAYRGRGYGRQMLLDAIDILLAEAWPQILIEVATDNQNALGLYQSCGFRVTRTYSFYRLMIV